MAAPVPSALPAPPPATGFLPAASAPPAGPGSSLLPQARNSHVHGRRPGSQAASHSLGTSPRRPQMFIKRHRVHIRTGPLPGDRRAQDREAAAALALLYRERWSCPSARAWASWGLGMPWAHLSPGWQRWSGFRLPARGASPRNPATGSAGAPRGPGTWRPGR